MKRDLTQLVIELAAIQMVAYGAWFHILWLLALATMIVTYSLIYKVLSKYFNNK